MISRTVRLFLLALSLVAVVTPARADCYSWECRRTVDTAECWIRYGPNTRFFGRGSDCTAGPTCGWFFNEGEWDVTCSYDCNITQCYDV